MSDLADFAVDAPEGFRIEDVKGARTAKFARDLKLWRSYGRWPLWIITGKDVEIVIPRRDQ